MKKIFLFTLSVMLSLGVFAQKKEVKAAEKALRKGDLDAAKTYVEKAESLMSNADTKTKARILYVKAMLADAQGNREEAIKDYVALQKFEKENHISKYSDKASAYLSKALNDLSQKFGSDFKNKDFAGALKDIELAYAISPTDDNLYYLAVLQLYNNKFQEAYDNFKKLYDKGYDGVHTVYKIYDKNKKEDIALPDEKTWKIYSKIDGYENPRKEKTPSKRAELISNMLYALNKLGKTDEAYQLIKKAEAEDPGNVDLLLGEANYYLKQEKHDKFVETMQKVFEKKPSALYAYNIGFGYYKLGNSDNAYKWFNKAIELDPSYKEAYLGASLVALKDEKKLVEQINENLNNPKKYDALMKQLGDVYRKALPYLEKYHELNPNDETTIRTLKKIYVNLEMNDKAKEMRELLKKMGK